MGGSLYSMKARSVRTETYKTMSLNDTFTQNKLRQAHESMKSQGLTKRVCADSENHPAVIPVIIALDVTGSMGLIPHELIKTGLPNIMGKLLNNGVDAALCFIAIGDHECDSAPLQVGQFESGDAELDMWLERTYLEGKGGGNAGESYQLAWLFASRFTQTDAYDKRNQKGFLFTIGDEPCLPFTPGTALNEILGTQNSEGVKSETLLKEAEERWNVFHLHITHSDQAQRSLKEWQDRLGQHCIEVSDYQKVAQVIGYVLVSNVASAQTTSTETPVEQNTETAEGSIASSISDIKILL